MNTTEHSATNRCPENHYMISDLELVGLNDILGNPHRKYRLKAGLIRLLNAELATSHSQTYHTYLDVVCMLWQYLTRVGVLNTNSTCGATLSNCPASKRLFFGLDYMSKFNLFLAIRCHLEAIPEPSSAVTVEDWADGEVGKPTESLV